MKIFHVLVRAYEEPVLRRSFGSDYEAYCARVPRWPGRRAAEFALVATIGTKRGNPCPFSARPRRR